MAEQVTGSAGHVGTDEHSLSGLEHLVVGADTDACAVLLAVDAVGVGGRSPDCWIELRFRLAPEMIGWSKTATVSVRHNPPFASRAGAGRLDRELQFSSLDPPQWRKTSAGKIPFWVKI